jgi:hypothetical protein
VRELDEVLQHEEALRQHPAGALCEVADDNAGGDVADEPGQCRSGVEVRPRQSIVDCKLVEE